MDLRLTRTMEAALVEAGLVEEVLDFTEPSGPGFMSGGEPGSNHFSDTGEEEEEGVKEEEGEGSAKRRSGGSDGGGGRSLLEDEKLRTTWSLGAKCRVGHCVTWANCTRGQLRDVGNKEQGGGGCGGGGSCAMGAAIQWECAEVGLYKLNLVYT